MNDQMRVLVTRPEPVCSETCADLKAAGHAPIAAPLLKIRFDTQTRLDLNGVQALVATSRNGIRALARHPSSAKCHDLPVYAVGDATEQEARAAGFRVGGSAGGDADALVRHLGERLNPADGPLLHLAGDKLAGDLKARLEQIGFCVRQPIVYHSETIEELPEDVIAILQGDGIDGVLLMSPRTARAYHVALERSDLVARAGNWLHFCISQAVSDRLGWLDAQARRVSAEPTRASLLELVNQEAAHLS